MIIIGEERYDNKAHGANEICAYNDVVFNHLIISPLSNITGNKNQEAEVVTLATGKGKSATRFSLTGNSPYFNRHRERVRLDDEDESGLVWFKGGTARQTIEAWEQQYGNFRQWDAVMVHFGAPVHFVDDDGNILKTILRVESMEEVPAPAQAADDSDADDNSNKA